MARLLSETEIGMIKSAVMDAAEAAGRKANEYTGKNPWWAENAERWDNLLSALMSGDVEFGQNGWPIACHISTTGCDYVSSIRTQLGEAITQLNECRAENKTLKTMVEDRNEAISHLKRERDDALDAKDQQTENYAASDAMLRELIEEAQKWAAEARDYLERAMNELDTNVCQPPGKKEE